ncbi:unnamed protein product [Schistocephalus solidus]|uniref:Peripheral subunit-binding (PSBD) domain-containing protein n=1 Tax=Schistocephalus solidus TaxID=70667 RepID=A0A183SKK5_SCHSO|nr:unnamed protein product [Schistocephalus solidus]
MLEQYYIFTHLSDSIAKALPNLSPTMETGTVVSWAKNEGDQPLCVIVESQDSVSAFADFKPDSAAAAPPSPPPPPPPAAAKPKEIPVEAPPKPAHMPVAAAPPPPAAKTPAPTTSSGGRVFISPLARRVALERGIDISRLGPGSGVDGSIILADLDNIVPSTAFKPGAEDYHDLPLSGMRATIAKRLTQSKQTIPHYYLTVDVEIDELLKLRSNLNDSIAKLSTGKEEKSTKISVNDIFIKAMAHASLCVPDCNSAWHGDFIRRYNSVDVCVAVATPEGLITPIIFGAEKKGIFTISQEVKNLAARAKANKLRPEEFQGGSITISNLGMFGISSFSAIINPPQACILSVGGARTCLVPDKHSPNGFRSAKMVSVTLGCDHRVVDGAVGAQWLVEFKSLVECPARMLM